MEDLSDEITIKARDERKLVSIENSNVDQNQMYLGKW